MAVGLKTMGEQILAATARTPRDCPPGPPPKLRTLVEIARWRARNQPDDLAYTFLIDGEEQRDNLTYHELDRRARQIAAGLQRQALGGERVLLLFHPGLDFNAAVFGCMYAGAVAVPVYPPDPFRAHRTLPRLQAILEDAQASVVLGSAEILQWAGEGIRRACGARTVSLESLLADPSFAWREELPAVDQLALLQYTSGSTGSPRGVMLTHGNLMHNLAALHRLDVEDAVAVCWVPPYHDMGLVGGLLLPVHSGRRVVLMSPLTFIERPVRWLWAVSRYRARTSPSPNFGYELCVKKVVPEECEGLDLSSWLAAINGAEPVRAETMDRFVEAFGPYGFRREAFYPAFGMAEATLLVTGGQRGDPPLVPSFSRRALEQGRVVEAALDAPEAQRLVGCGQPVPGSQVVIVDPATLRPQPAGHVGEIWIRSPSVGLGYWNRPEENARLFRARLQTGTTGSPIAGNGNGRRFHEGSDYLRTGDLGFVFQGQLFVTGRLKELIILGGRNFYPSDIERVVHQADLALKLDGGAAFSVDVDGEERLVIVQEVLRPKRCDPQALFRKIRKELIEEFEIVPHAIALIPAGSLPKTSSGKTRRRACRESFLQGELDAVAVWRAEPAPGAASEPPRTPTEERLAEFWREVLRVLAVGRDDDFFALGGQSLGAAQLLARIHDEFGVEMPWEVLLERPTVAGMAGWIEDRHARSSPGETACRPEPIPRRQSGAPLVLSSAEQRVWFFDQLQPHHPFYNMPVAARIRGPLVPEALEAGLRELVGRHDTLRTTYRVEEGRPVRRIADEPTASLERVDLAHLSGQNREAELRRRMAEAARRPFDLSRGPLARFVLFRLGADEHVLLLALHHIVADGWSVGVLVRELGAVYQAVLRGEASPLAPNQLEYADYAAWQQRSLDSPSLQRDLEYWRQRLGDGPPPLDLPTDRPRPARQSFEGATRPVELDPALWTQLKHLARREGTTPFVILLAAYQVLWSRWCRQEDIAVGTIAANRARRELERLVGFFANTLVLRTDLSGEPTFRQLIGRANQVAMEAYQHQAIPFERLVERLQPERSAARAPLFQVALVLENMPLELPSRRHTPHPQPLSHERERGAFAADSELRVERVAVDNGTSKYDLAMLLWDEAGRVRGEVEYATALFDPATVDRMIRAFVALLEAALDDPDRPISRLPLLDPAERTQILAQSCPAPADLGPPSSLHGLFEAHADQTPRRVAVRDRGKDVTYDELNRQANRMARWLVSEGVGPAQPVTVCLPRSLDLVVAMLAVLKAGAVYVPIDPDQPTERLAFLMDDSGSRLVITPAIFRDRIRMAMELLDDDPLDIRVEPEQLAYILYTSGTTGRPKGAMIEHQGAVNFTRSFSRVLDLDRDDRVLFSFSPSSDGSISDTFSALANGACLVIADPPTVLEPGELQELLRQEQVTAATLTPSLMKLLRPEDLPELRTVCAVGETLPADLAARWVAGRRLLNGYGLTETSIGVSLSDVTRAGGARPPIGRPLENVSVYLLDPRLEPVPIGMPGEICVGGVQVGRGYLNLPELTAQRFVKDPFRDEPGARLYRTGDLGRSREDGSIEFLGRFDDQVKIRGFRVEPDEIAARLREHPRVDQAAVIVREDQPGVKRLVGYVVPKPRGGMEPGAFLAELRAYLQARLPEAMIPAALVILERLPRSVQGKLDRRALPPPPDRPEGVALYVAPRDDEETLVAEVWQELLGVRPVGARDDFFALGGHSLLAVQLMAAIERRTGRRLPLASLFQEPTVEHLARLLRAPAASPPEASLVLLQPARTGRPMFCVHPAGGTVFCYRALAEHLGPERPLYGLQAVGIDGARPPHERIEEMAAYYIEAIRGVQAHGPYLLGGWSLGGTLAFEVARQLSEQGEPIGLLALFDTAPLHADRAPDQEEFLPLLMDFFPGQAHLPLETLRTMSAAEQAEYFVQRAAEAQIVMAAGDTAAGRAIFDVFGASMQAILNYRQKVYPGKVTLFAAEHRQELFAAARDPGFGWGAWAQGGVEVYRVPGDHIHMVLEPHVEQLAEKLRRCLRAADHS